MNLDLFVFFVKFYGVLVVRGVGDTEGIGSVERLRFGVYVLVGTLRFGSVIAGTVFVLYVLVFYR